MSAPTFTPALSAEYAAKWERMQTLPQYKKNVNAAAFKILGYKARYQEVSKATGVPWWFIGLTHMRESNCNFHGHLHNGDPLNKRTRQVPAGRPEVGNPPFTWEESAMDALGYMGLTKVKEWPFGRLAYELERYNGFGYRNMGVASDYLWAWSDQDAPGKYVADGKYDSNAQSGQPGALPVFAALIALDPSILKAPVPAPTGDPKVDAKRNVLLELFKMLLKWLLELLVGLLKKK